MNNTTNTSPTRYHASRVGWHVGPRDQGCKHAYPVEAPAGTSSLCGQAECDGPDSAVPHHYPRFYCADCSDLVLPTATVTPETFEDYPVTWRCNNHPNAVVEHAYIRGAGNGDGSICGRATHDSDRDGVRGERRCERCVNALDTPVKATTVDACDRCQTADLSLDHTCVLRPVTVTEQDLRFLLDQHIELLGGPDEVLSTDDRTIDVLGNIRDALDGV